MLDVPTYFNPLDRGNLYQIPKEPTYRILSEVFQSPRSGKFVSDLEKCVIFVALLQSFNPLDQGNLYQIMEMLGSNENSTQPFQSPRSGKFVSNLWASKNMSTLTLLNGGFNPLDRGNLYLICRNF